MEISKVVAYEYWYEYVNKKYEKRLCWVDADSFVVYIKTKGIYVHIAKDVETRFVASNYDKPLTKKRNKKSNWINE